MRDVHTSYTFQGLDADAFDVRWSMRMLLRGPRWPEVETWWSDDGLMGWSSFALLLALLIIAAILPLEHVLVCLIPC